MDLACLAFLGLALTLGWAAGLVMGHYLAKRRK